MSELKEQLMRDLDYFFKDAPQDDVARQAVFHDAIVDCFIDLHDDGEALKDMSHGLRTRLLITYLAGAIAGAKIATSLAMAEALRQSKRTPH